MIIWLESLPTGTAGVIIVGGIVLLALAIGYLVAKFTPQNVRNAHNDRAGFILAVIGVIYAVLLAFVAIGVWERFQGAESRTYEEASALATLYRDAGVFPSKVHIRASLRRYVDSVIDGEWPRMHRGERPELANARLEEVAREVRHLPVTSSSLSNIQAQMLAAVDVALMDRQARLTVDASGINGIMWFVLIAGAVVTIAFTYLFGFDQTVMQQLMIGGLSFLIALVLFVIVALDYPFRGSIAVAPEAFRALTESLAAISR